MKMWKRLLSLFVAVMMILPSGMVFAEEKRVEITFCVGDETLLINGEAVTVEKPYVVGEGVTLVPLRVITEAFGATVDWDDATKSITLTYPGVSILLQIGNPIAEVNGKAETLLAAPELPTEYTMVPLRFISENFGATVSYDEETEKITVVKEAAGSGGLLEGAVDSKYIGDSYYNWNMENPVDMPMVERTFAGTYTAFENKAGYIEIDIYAVSEDYNFEKDFADIKAGFHGSTLIKADKNTNNKNKQTMHFQGKDKESFWNIRQIVTPKYIYMVYGAFDLEATEEKDEAIRIMDTFDLGIREEDFHDMSTVENGIRRFSDEHLKIGMDIPENHYQLDTEGSLNVFQFMSFEPDDDRSTIAFGVYSTAEVGDAKTMAEADFQRNKATTNEEISEFSDGVAEKQYGEFSAYEYSYTMNKTSGEEYMRDVFFCLGKYTYNVTIYVKLPMENMNEYVSGLLNSVSAELLDPNEAGILMRNMPDEEEETFAVAFGDDGTVQVPVSYQEKQISSVSTALYNRYSGVGISLQKTDATQWGYPSVVDEVKRLEAKLAIQKSNEILESTTQKTLGKNTFGVFSYRTTEDGETVYFQVYGYLKKGDLYLAIAGYPEVAYSEKNREEVADILRTFELKKED